MKAVISGYGRMGHMVEACLQEKGIEYVATDDVRSVDPAVAAESVCIDFTTPAAFMENYVFIAENFMAAVIGTTGWNGIREQVEAAFRENGKTMVHASNFSIGVNVLFCLAKYASELLGEDYVPSIEEIHHVHKLDAPSGTAKTLAQEVASVRGAEPEITSVREGEVPGIHTLELRSAADKITITHEAFSREGFARGAVEAAIRTERLSGVYEFKDIIFQ